MTSMYKARTIDELIASQYGQEVAKADAPMLTTTTGFWQAKIGPKVYMQLNQASPTFQMLPKFEYPGAGVRAISARAVTLGSLAGSAESAAVSDTTKPTFVTYSVKLKIVQQTFEISFLAENSYPGDDMVNPEEIVNYMGNEFVDHISQMLMASTDAGVGANDIESIDHVCSSSVEATAGLFAAGNEDIYSIDRSANTVFNAQVNHASGVDRAVTQALLLDLIQKTETAGANPAGQVFITGPDTAVKIDALFNNQVFYTNVQQEAVDRMRQDPAKATTVGLLAGKVFGRPMYVDPKVPKDTGSRVYLVDISDFNGLPKLGLQFGTLPKLVKADNPLTTDKLATQYMHYTTMELRCSALSHQGKLRDLL